MGLLSRFRGKNKKSDIYQRNYEETGQQEIDSGDLSEDDGISIDMGSDGLVNSSKENRSNYYDELLTKISHEDKMDINNIARTSQSLNDIYRRMEEADIPLDYLVALKLVEEIDIETYQNAKAKGLDLKEMVTEDEITNTDEGFRMQVQSQMEPVPELKNALSDDELGLVEEQAQDTRDTYQKTMDVLDKDAVEDIEKRPMENKRKDMEDHWNDLVSFDDEVDYPSFDDFDVDEIPEVPDFEQNRPYQENEPLQTQSEREFSSYPRPPLESDERDSKIVDKESNVFLDEEKEKQDIPTGDEDLEDDFSSLDFGESTDFDDLTFGEEEIEEEVEGNEYTNSEDTFSEFGNDDFRSDVDTESEEKMEEIKQEINEGEYANVSEEEEVEETGEDVSDKFSALRKLTDKLRKPKETDLSESHDRVLDEDDATSDISLEDGEDVLDQFIGGEDGLDDEVTHEEAVEKEPEDSNKQEQKQPFESEAVMEKVVPSAPVEEKKEVRRVYVISDELLFPLIDDYEIYQVTDMTQIMQFTSSKKNLLVITQKIPKGIQKEFLEWLRGVESGSSKYRIVTLRGSAVSHPLIETIISLDKDSLDNYFEEFGNERYIGKDTGSFLDISSFLD